MNLKQSKNKQKLQNIFNQALQFHQAGCIQEAINLYLKILPQQISDFQLLYFLGSACYQIGKYSDAVKFLKQAVTINPNNFAAFNNLGLALQDLKRFDEALDSYNRALTLKPDFAEAYNNRGNVLQALKRLDEALDSYDRALKLKPDYAEAYNNRGNVLQDLERLDEALVSFDQALTLQPDFADSYFNRGNVLKTLKRLDEALDSYDRALTLKPGYAEAYNNRGNVLKTLKRLDEALDSYDRALTLKPGYAEAYNNRGNALKALKCLDKALVSYDQALTLKPDYAEAYNNRGNVLQDLERLDEALDSYDRALTLNPDCDFLKGARLHTKMFLCKWDDFDVEYDELIANIEQFKRASNPFPILALIDSLTLQKTTAEIYTQNKYPSCSTVPAFTVQTCERIRIGYFSADFHNHATMHLMAEMFEHHDKERFEIYAFSFGPCTNDEWQERARQSFAQFIECRNKSDEDIATLSRGVNIDVAIDLKGFTQDCRTEIFANRVAPIQVNFLGYPGTMGAEYVDYIIADNVLIPEQSRQWYSEKIAYLPNCYQPNCKTRKVSDKVISRSDFGLPEHGVVFCSFNNQYKITPDVFGLWMRVLQAVDDSILWLFATNHTAEQNLRTEALLHGINANRLVFAQNVDVEEHLNRIRLADLMLDSFPYGAHTTCSDALRMGLPVLTRMGESFASRVAGSLLHAVNLPELITFSDSEYENLAIRLAQNPEELVQVRNKLEINLKTSSLFDSELFVRDIESLYITMYQRYRYNVPLDHILL